MAHPVDTARTFAAELREALGDRVTAAVLFGSAARGEWIRGVSDINVLVLVDAVNTRLLADASSVCSRWAAEGVAPLLMAGEEWARAHDVFGIELADMREAHVALFGGDPTGDVQVPPHVVRLQAEREIRSKLLHLHGGLLLAAENPPRIGELLRLSLPSFATYLRAALRLAEKAVPTTTAEVIDVGCALIDAPPTPFATVLAQRAHADWAVPVSDPLVEAYNAAAERLASFIDSHGR